MLKTSGVAQDNPVKRRGLMAGIAALAAAALTRVSVQPAHAASGDPVLQGRTNTPGDATIIQAGGFSGLISTSTGAVGVQGGSTNSLGVFGSSTNSVGVWGGSTNNTGFLGTSTGSAGVFGQSTSGSGVQGLTNSGGALVGTSTSGPGVQASSSSNYAGLFSGGLGVLINGNFTATGIKSAAVPHPDGSLRRLYCLESPESFFEDFGEAKLVRGSAHVQLEADFAAVVHTDGYRVFVTPEGDCNGLYVSAKGPNRFEVHELQGGRSSLTFSYRVVARRKDVVGPRLEKVAREQGVKPQAAPALPTGVQLPAGLRLP